MRPEKGVERAFRQANLEIEINTETDRAILESLVETQRANRHRPWCLMGRNSLVRVAAVAAVVTAAALVIDRRIARHPVVTSTEPEAQARTEMVNAIALNMAYRRGGMEAVDEQYRRFAIGSKPGPVRSSVPKLLKEIADDSDGGERKLPW